MIDNNRVGRGMLAGMGLRAGVEEGRRRMRTPSDDVMQCVSQEETRKNVFFRGDRGPLPPFLSTNGRESLSHGLWVSLSLFLLNDLFHPQLFENYLAFAQPLGLLFASHHFWPCVDYMLGNLESKSICSIPKLFWYDHFCRKW